MLISLDFGITITDILRKKEDGKLIHHMLPSDQKPSEHFILDLFKDLNFKKEVDCIALTGGHHHLIGDTIEETRVLHVNEVDAIGEGGFYLSELDPSKPAIIVSAGSGTACILAKDGEFLHCSGTGVGGGTVLGLSKLLLDTIDPQEIQELADQGLAKGTDLIIKDVVSGPIGLLPPDTTAVNFGKIVKSKTRASREDLAAGIVNLVGEVVARIATSVAAGFGVSEIIVVGRAPAFTVLRKSLEDAAKLTNFTPHFPENAEYASALGAMLVAEKTPLAKN